MRLFFLVLILIPGLAFSQKWIGSDTWHEIDMREAIMTKSSQLISSDTSSIKDFLKQTVSNLKNSDSHLVLTDFKTSPKARHYRFSQTLNGRKLFRGAIKLNVSNDGRILTLFDNTYPIDSEASSTFPDHQPYHDGLMVHYNTPGNGRLHHYNLEEVYFPVNGQLQPAIRLEVVEQSDRYYEMILNTDVEVIYQNDLLSYSAPAPQDSIVTLWVFNPDPLTTANETYGAPYADNSDNDVLELNAERVSVQAIATYNAGTFSLENDFVAIQEFSSPNVQPATSTVPEFNFTRAESGFEDANAFYHITNFQNYIQSLGFDDIVNYQIAVDAHAVNGADNSNFNGGFNPPRLQFGEGGVDDAEDADVIIHEYGHAIMHSAAPGTNSGTQRRALDEAVGDYFASSYSRFLNSYRWEDVFTWDGHNEYWNGRSTVSSDHYPDDLNNNLYTDADIWSATLMQIWGDIGREATDAIMIEAGYSFASNMTMAQAAELFVQADTLLFNGIHSTPIRQRMCDRGLLVCNVGIDENELPNLNFDILNTAGFTSGNSNAKIVAQEAVAISVFNAVGQLLFTDASGNGLLEISSKGLVSGFYLLEVSTKTSSSTIKLVKQ